VASALDHAASHGVFHRDIKPSNILLGPDGNAKITDLGLAKEGTRLTESEVGFAVGSPRYIAPERLTDQGRADVRADLYSLGLTMIRMITGELPLVGETDVKTMRRHVYEEVPLASSFMRGIPPIVDAIGRLLTAREPDARYSDGLAASNDITALLTGTPPPIASTLLARGTPTTLPSIPGIIPDPPASAGPLTPAGGVPTGALEHVNLAPRVAGPPDMESSGELELAPEAEPDDEPRLKGPKRRIKRFRSGRHKRSSSRMRNISSRRMKRG